MSQPLIVRVGDLGAFTGEVPPVNGPVRLILTNRSLKSGVIPTREIQLSLQGFNDLLEMVWLCESHEITWLDTGPPPGRDKSIYDAMFELRAAARAHLESQGYEVREGNYGLPDDIHPIAGRFEIVRWQKGFDGIWGIVALDREPEHA